ncbi:Nucleolar complex protein 4 [Phytophthora pseudosyringae]|uniref:Nucleolar complex protein 4 n=1 Tax=Phytophthora pseudosyringae TaxID=221518 RepID=A0A8T1WB83_9STRA|nr:Nucleolar complex protein 4 [Phytophthora pseudosyringae]
MASAAEIKQLEARIKEDVKQIKELPKVVRALQHSDKAVAQAAVQSMRRVLLFFLEKGDLKPKPSELEAAKKAKGSDAQAIDKFRCWLWDVYVSFIREMLQWLGDARADSNLRVGALRTLMEFVSREGEIRGGNAPTFGNETFARVVQELATTEKLKGELASVFKGEYVGAYVDVQYYTVRDDLVCLGLKNLAQILDSEQSKEDKDEADDLTLVANALRMLAMVQMPYDDEEITSFLVETKESNLPEQELVSSDDESDDEEGGEVPATTGSKRKAASDPKKAKKTRGLRNMKQHQHAFSLAWIAVLRHKLPQASYKKVLVQLPDEIMPHLVNPLLLADFLTDSYSIGGVTSLLALNSLFILIQDYNFDSPDFYNKLYALLDDPTLYSAKQRDRFFGLLSLFLASTHLPAYTVAAFAKRLSRSALTAEPGAVLFIIPMVYNLILRHKECLQLIHRTGAFTAAEKAAKRREELSSGSAVDAAAKKLSNEKTELVLKDGHDPFINDELDPIKCNALQSSLWELYTMKHHYNADVALKARMFEEKLRHQFVDVDESMEITYKSLFDKQLKRKDKGKVPLAFQPCKALFSNGADAEDSEAKDEDNIFAKVFEL